jgi:hypothetical protein
VINPKKTNNGQFVSAHACTAENAAQEFFLKKVIYKQLTGREREKKSDVIVYQIRQSFKPGKVTPEIAN